MIGLAFSGGKDSWACLHLNAHRLHEIDVIWVNTGKNYPELLQTVELAKAMCPRFHEVRTNQQAQNDRMGIPAEVVPIDWTSLGHMVSGAKEVVIQSYLGCCHDNISAPLHAKAKELGLTELIRGQRLEDARQGTSRDGMVVDGIVYRHPIESWTTGQVMAFLSERMEIPGHFAFKHSSMDCYDCTAYRRESSDRIAYMEREHPMLFRAYAARAEKLDRALSAALQ